MHFKKRNWLWIGGAAAYLSALALLTLAERNAPGGSIRTFADAFWYSLVTMSTVGYGDLYPVTLPGRLLGGCFILLSLGLLTFLLGILIRIVTGRLMPNLQLWLARNKTWYIFSCQNSAALALAENLAAQDPDCAILFPAGSDTALPCLTYTGSPEIPAGKKKDRCHILFLDEENPYARAVAALETGHPVYCRTAFRPDVCPDNLTLFDPYDCCARRYWQDYGLTRAEQSVVILGDGQYAENLLTQGLLTNVFQPERTITYHLFGCWEEYLRNHHQLAQSLNQTEADRLLFHGSLWNEDAALLAEADRIILCRDDPAENMEILGKIHQYFPVTGKIHLLSGKPIPGEIVFGTEKAIYTPQFVLREQLNRAARAIHGLYRNTAAGNAPSWEGLSDFLRQSNLAAAGHLLTKIRILLEDDSITAITPDNCRKAYDRYRSLSPEQKEACRQIEHRRWMRFHTLYNWRYAPLRDNAAREHPLMQPYDALSPADQAKDDPAWELLGRLADRL